MPRGRSLPPKGEGLLLKGEGFKATLEQNLWVLFFRHHRAFVFSCFLIQVKHFER